MVIGNFSQFLDAAAGRGLLFNAAYVVIFFTILTLGLLAYFRDKITTSFNRLSWKILPRLVDRGVR